MTESPARVRDIQDLKSLSRPELRKVFMAGACPVLTSFNGAADGVVLGASVLAALNLWRGKRFEGSCVKPGEVSGINRIGLGAFSWERYRFTGALAPSLYRSEPVLLINHDQASNPSWVRIFHDEVVQVGPRLYLGQSHRRVKGRLVFAGYFALKFPR